MGLYIYIYIYIYFFFFFFSCLFIYLFTPLHKISKKIKYRHYIIYAKCVSPEFGFGFVPRAGRVTSASQWLSNFQCLYNATDAHQKRKPNLLNSASRILKSFGLSPRSLLVSDKSTKHEKYVSYYSPSL